MAEHTIFRVQSKSTKTTSFIGSKENATMRCRSANAIADYERFEVVPHFGVETASPHLTQRERATIRVMLPSHIRNEKPPLMIPDEPFKTTKERVADYLKLIKT